MDTNIESNYANACVKTNRLLAFLFVTACIGLGLQMKKIESLNNEINNIKRNERDRTANV